MDIIIVGAGLTGLTAAIRLAEGGARVRILEMAPLAGGRTRSFLEPTLNTWVDHGPHLLIGAYEATNKLLNDVHAAEYVHWQSALNLPLWEKDRGFFSLSTSQRLPFPLALMLATYRLPSHGISSVLSMLGIAKDLQFGKSAANAETVSQWVERLHLAPMLYQDFIEPLCLGAMNELPESANAASFKAVLDAAFANHQTARLGWFTRPLQQALIEPLCNKASLLGVEIITHCRVTHIQTEAGRHGKLITSSGELRCDTIVLAVPPNIRYQITGQTQATKPVPHRPITNIHMWFKEKFQLPAPIMGALATYGQWFFDVSQQHQNQYDYTHICAIISADNEQHDKAWKLNAVIGELRQMTGMKELTPFHHRMITVKAATHQVNPADKIEFEACMVDACEQPLPGEFPATIEAAVMRGEAASKQLLTIS